ncbi:putative RNA recognition motif domain, nucleotide-binding alpha-beta plait domain superfamily [Helianthus annuus]|uniref:uncharacterized protein LOC110892379 n=1 Tax=Helianthus annuus TaxID=4232 RepID=UPI000B8FBDC1|nr:uncharacterized protein LOC110892379 [Helianthus annuus]KAJ0560871.1 putative RNA recognition motif domain, nucleotide-binding alpha-beta plait domain superfamily [Helianthus annuus]KAJ0573911.1 putative RNA recognition motif domain, nucleotide-binding alpha-beta plait domain superfamily [Helianthus annuus]KAJ0738245.1 putative RNA recognition motif domain, nucleotide-binding alpha-beta plait domain superfamily [Helianthus annuus]KAJ0741139.1 putative RNA recognition motif domain, nucleotide
MSNSIGQITKFYVTNLPNGVTPWEVSDFVRVFGNVAGVYIARKKDKEGRKFGFISFRNVVDVKEMERTLNGTKMGGFKLKVNVAKFAMENEGFHGEATVKDKGKTKVHANQPQILNHANAFTNNGGGKLFKDLFSNSHGDQGESSKPRATEEGNGNMIVVPDDTLAFKELRGKALVGRCMDFTVLRTLDNLLDGAGIKGVSLSYLGGLSLLIKFVDNIGCTEFLLNHSVWEHWFSSLDNWSGQSLPFERLAWVRVQGVPIHLAENSVFDSIAGQFGKIVYGS